MPCKIYANRRLGGLKGGHKIHRNRQWQEWQILSAMLISGVLLDPCIIKWRFQKAHEATAASALRHRKTGKSKSVSYGHYMDYKDQSIRISEFEATMKTALRIMFLTNFLSDNHEWGNLYTPSYFVFASVFLLHRSSDRFLAANPWIVSPFQLLSP